MAAARCPLPPTRRLSSGDLETGNPLASFTADSDLFAVAIAANDRFVAGSHGSVTLPNRARNKSPGTFGSRCGYDFTLRLQGRCAEDSVRSCRGEMALDVEGVVDCCMKGEKSLR